MIIAGQSPKLRVYSGIYTPWTYWSNLGTVVGTEKNCSSMNITSKNLFTVPDGKYRIEQNLYLDVRRGGASRLYVFRYTFNGKRRDMSLGCPEMKNLTIAKRDAAKCKALLARGIDPLQDRKEQRDLAKVKVTTFREYHDSIIEDIFRIKQYKRPSFETDHLYRMQKYVYPVIGNKDISKITTADIASILKPIWATKSATCVRIRCLLENVFDFARRDGHIAGINPALWRGNLSVYLPSLSKVHKVQHRKAPTVEELKSMLPTLVKPCRYSETGMAIIFGAMSGARRSEWALARWEEVDFEKRTLSVHPSRRKDGRHEPFVIPLSDQMVWILKHQKPRASGMIFHSVYENKTLSPDSLSDLVLRVSKQKYCLHGFRSTFRDWAAENGINPIIAEKCLCHKTGTTTEMCYQRSDLLEQRRPVIQQWSDVLMDMDFFEQFQTTEETAGVDADSFRNRVGRTFLRRKRQLK